MYANCSDGVIRCSGKAYLRRRLVPRTMTALLLVPLFALLVGHLYVVPEICLYLARYLLSALACRVGITTVGLADKTS